MKKISIAVFSLAAFLLAGTALAAANATGVNSQSGQEIVQQAPTQTFTAPADSSGNVWYGQPGNFFMMRGQPYFAGASGNSQYQPMMAWGYGNNFLAWYHLMCVITVALIWVVLLLLIGFLWKLNKKHK